MTKTEIIEFRVPVHLTKSIRTSVKYQIQFERRFKPRHQLVSQMWRTLEHYNKLFDEYKKYLEIEDEVGLSACPSMEPRSVGRLLLEQHGVIKNLRKINPEED